MDKEIKAAIKLLEENGYIITPPPDNGVIPQDFLQWWKMYDKQINRKKCLNLWLKLTEKERKDCIANTPLYVASTSDNKQFRKNPETFLRNKSFYDEVIIRDSKEQQRKQRIDESAALVAKYSGTTK